MYELKINGGKRLKGTVNISGAKNAALAIIPATIISSSKCIIENLPEIDDVILLKDIFEQLNIPVSFKNGVMEIDNSKDTDYTVNFELVKKMRASYYLLGAMLARYNKAEISLPGGCEIGARPIDLHIKGLTALGAKVKVEHGKLKAEAPNGLKGTDIYLDFASVGATINIMLAASKAVGVTTISNAAKEPHVVDVANFLNCIGASVKGAGTDNIRITGKTEMKGCAYSVIPDQLEAGTFMIAAAATGGDVIIRNIIPNHLEAVSAKLMEMGVNVIEGDNGREFYINVKHDQSRCREVNIKTLPYPGFPTDLQQPIMAMLTQSLGTSIIVENVFEDRYKHVASLQRMGADINVNGRVAAVKGVEQLSGTEVFASDLRAGAALIIAGLIATGTTTIQNVHYIDRGYEKIEEKLQALGADIERVLKK